MAFKMRGFSGFGNSPMKQDKLGRKVATKTYEDTRTDEQKAKDKREGDRQTKIQTQFQNRETHRRRDVKNQLYHLGHFQDKDGSVVYPFGKHKKMDKAKWDEWKSKPDNQPYKGETKGLIP